MTISFLNRCIWSSLTNGLTDFSIGAAAQNGYTPGQCLDPTATNGATYHYVATNDTGQHEEGDGTYNSGTQVLARTTIRNSSNGGAKVNFNDFPTVIMGGPIATDLSSSGGMSIGGAITGGTTPSVLFIGAGNVLAQDPTNFGWDDTNYILTIGNNSTAPYSALNMQNDSGSVFISGGPSHSVFAGGIENVAIGTSALSALTSGAYNCGFGYQALTSTTTNNHNTAFGRQALANLNTVSSASASSFNVAIGDGTGTSLTQGFQNTYIGPSAGTGITSGGASTLIGSWAGPSGALSNVIALSDGNFPNSAQLVYNYISSNVWAFNKSTTAIGLHVYNTYDNAVPTVNYERGVFDWNITSNTLLIGTPSSSAGGTGVLRDTQIWSAGIPALYRVPAVGGDNWFEAGAGNFTVTGSGNFGTGSNCLTSLTTGASNVGLGANALQVCSTGGGNLAIGAFAMQLVGTASFNTAIGPAAIKVLSAGSYNIGVGDFALSALSAGSGNVAIGAQAGGVSAGSYNVMIGYLTAPLVGTFNQNTILGAAGFENVTNASYCTVVGTWAGPSASLSNIIAFSDGSFPAAPQMDYTYTVSNVWTFQKSTTAQGIHVYNTTDGLAPPTNYERFCLDWNLTSNVARFASQAGGTGTVRMIAIDGFQKAGAPAAGDLPSGTWGLINDTSGGNTWLVYNNSGTIRKVQLV